MNVRLGAAEIDSWGYFKDKTRPTHVEGPRFGRRKKGNTKDGDDDGFFASPKGRRSASPCSKTMSSLGGGYCRGCATVSSSRRCPLLTQDPT
uniref:TIP_N domain-containing protein n=1 Tax=Steinernema glaseri TaxID=37863 RepID=A0A1I7ZLC9_9BILA